VNLTLRNASQPKQPFCSGAQAGCRAAELCHLGECDSLPARLRSVIRGDCLSRQGHSNRRFLAIRRGLVATCAIMPDGRRQILYLSAPGDVICSMANEGAESWHEALTPTELCEFDYGALSGLVQRSPTLSNLVFAVMHDRLERTAVHLALLGRFDAIERICSFLIDMARRIGQRMGSKWSLDLPMSREDIADYLGLNPDTVGRVLKRVREEGLIDCTGPSLYEITNIQRLQARVPVLFEDKERASVRRRS